MSSNSKQDIERQKEQSYDKFQKGVVNDSNKINLENQKEVFYEYILKQHAFLMKDIENSKIHCLYLMNKDIEYNHDDYIKCLLKHSLASSIQYDYFLKNLENLIQNSKKQDIAALYNMNIYGEDNLK